MANVCSLQCIQLHEYLLPTIYSGNSIRPLGPCPNVGAKVYFTDENVQFYQLHRESELRLPKDCVLTSWSMTRYVLCLLNLHGSFATGIDVISIEGVKLQNLIIEHVFFFWAL